MKRFLVSIAFAWSIAASAQPCGVSTFGAGPATFNSSTWTASLIGFPEFAIPSSPPKMYRRLTLDGGITLQFDDKLAGYSGCAGGNFDQLYQTASGSFEYGTDGSVSADNIVWQIHDLGNNTYQQPDGTTSDVIESSTGPDVPWFFNYYSRVRTVTNTQTVRTISGSGICVTDPNGINTWYENEMGDFHETLSVEDTEADAIARAITTTGQENAAYNRTHTGTATSWGWQHTTVTVKFPIKCPGTYAVTFTFQKISPDGTSTTFSLPPQNVYFRDKDNATMTETIPLNQNGGSSPEDNCTFSYMSATAEGTCTNRAAGDAYDYLDSIHSGFQLGHINGVAAGWIRLDADVIDASVFTPAALTVPAYTGIETTYDGANLRQVRAPEALVDIQVLDATTYTMSFYYAAQIGTKDPATHLYSFSGNPYVTYRIDNPDGSLSPLQSRLRITKIQGSLSQEKIYQFDATRQAWSLTIDGSTERHTEWFDTNGNRNVLIEMLDASGKIASAEQKTYGQFSWGEELVQDVADPSGAALATTYEYEGPPSSGGYGAPSGGYGPPPPTGPGHLSRVIYPDGSWERYEYDTDGVTLLKTTRPFLNAPPDAPEEQCRVSTITHSTTVDADGDGVPERLDTNVEYTLGQETARSYTIYYSAPISVGGTSFQRTKEIACAAAGAAPDAPTNLVTTRLTYIDGPMQGMDRFVINPDNTASSTEVTADATGQQTVVLKSGEPNTAGTDIVSGTKKVSVLNAAGEVLAQTETDIGTGLTLTSWVAGQLDELGRPTRLNYSDGTFVLRSYACCGLESERDRLGLTTSYTYDSRGRLHTSKRSGITTRFEYDAAGRQTDTFRIGTDDTSLLLSHDEYDLAGRLILSQAFGVRTTSYTESIDASGETTKTTTYPDGGTKVEVFARDGSPISVSGSAALPLAYEYSLENGEVAAKTIKVGSSGETTEWSKTYTDFLGRRYKTVYPDGAVEAKYFNGQGQITRQVDADGVTTLFAYNGRGEQEVVATDMNGNGVIDYAGPDRITKTISSVGTKTDAGASYTVNRLTTLVWPDDSQDTPTTLAVVEQSTDGLHSWRTVAGQTTTTVTAVLPDGTNTVTSTSPEGVATVKTYSGEQLLEVSIWHATLGTLSSETYQYDPLGRLQASTNARVGTTSYTYWPTGDVQSVTTPKPDSSKSGPGYDPETTTYTYDAAGRIATVTQPDGGVVNATYWPTGAAKRVWGARTYPTEYSYDSQRRIKTLTTWKNFAGNTGSAVTTWNYDGARGFVSGKRYADNSGSDTTYTPAGRLLSRRSAGGVAANYTYNAGGDIVQVSYSNGDSTVASTYDRLGRIATRSDSAGLCRYTYAGVTAAAATESYTGGVLAGTTVSRQYDTQLRLIEVSATTGSATPATDYSYTYDPASRVDTVTFGTNTATYAYAPSSSMVAAVTFRNGGETQLATTTTYDRLDRVSGTSALPAHSNTISHVYTYNAANQRVRATREDASYWTYGFDSLGQTVSGQRHGSDEAVMPGHDFAWTYDDIGNRVSETANAQTTAYTSNILNQYSTRTVPAAVDVLGQADAEATVTVSVGALPQATARAGELFYKQVPVDNSLSSQKMAIVVTGVKNAVGPHGEDAVSQITRTPFVAHNPESFAYDADGNLIDDAQWHYSWNAENRLTALETSVGAAAAGVPRHKIEFLYDGLGRRVSKKVSGWDGANWILTGATLFVYDGSNLLAELDALHGNSVIRNYVWGNDLSGTLEGAGGIGGVLAFTANFAGQSETHYFAYDGNGNVTALITAANGSVAARYGYSPTGKTLVADGTAADDNPIRFSTKYGDPETGLLYYGYRYYSPGTGRWLGRDPLGENESANLYTAVGNDQIDHCDFNGLYGDAGHFYTTYLVGRAAGFSDEAAWQLAYWSEYADKDAAFDAIRSLGDEDHIDVQKYLHSLTGGDPTKLRTYLACLLKAKADDGKTEAFGLDEKGFLIHALGDTYAHAYDHVFVAVGPPQSARYIWKPIPEKLFPPHIGHFSDGHHPDYIAANPAKFGRYVDQLYGLLSSMNDGAVTHPEWIAGLKAAANNFRQPGLADFFSDNTQNGSESKEIRYLPGGFSESSRSGYFPERESNPAPGLTRGSEFRATLIEKIKNGIGGCCPN